MPQTYCQELLLFCFYITGVIHSNMWGMKKTTSLFDIDAKITNATKISCTWISKARVPNKQKNERMEEGEREQKMPLNFIHKTWILILIVRLSATPSIDGPLLPSPSLCLSVPALMFFVFISASFRSFKFYCGASDDWSTHTHTHIHIHQFPFIM